MYLINLCNNIQLRQVDFDLALEKPCYLWLLEIVIAVLLPKPQGVYWSSVSKVSTYLNKCGNVTIPTNPVPS